MLPPLTFFYMTCENLRWLFCPIRFHLRSDEARGTILKPFLKELLIYNRFTSLSCCSFNSACFCTLESLALTYLLPKCLTNFYHPCLIKYFPLPSYISPCPVFLHDSLLLPPIFWPLLWSISWNVNTCKSMCLFVQLWPLTWAHRILLWHSDYDAVIASVTLYPLVTELHQFLPQSRQWKKHLPSSFHPPPIWVCVHTLASWLVSNVGCIAIGLDHMLQFSRVSDFILQPVKQWKPAKSILV